MSRRRFLCLDCGVDTGRIDEHYFVHTSLWLSVVGSIRGMLCIGCLESRLGRCLVASDFTDATVNSPRFSRKSARLMERMGHGGLPKEAGRLADQRRLATPE